MSQKSMKLPKLYRIIVDVQFGDMLDECNKLYDGELSLPMRMEMLLLTILNNGIVMNGLTMIFAAKNQGG